jgi:hypothetical protein
MAKIWQPQPKEVLQHWYDSIMDEASDDLNDWEINFLESVNKYLTKGWNLSQTMEEKLESIYADKTK